MIFRTGQHSKLVRATFVLYMITKWLPSYNCCKITITNFNELVLSCTQFDKTVQKENKSNQRRVKIHRILTFQKGQNNYAVTSCGDAKIYWIQLTSSSLRRLHIALRNLQSSVPPKIQLMNLLFEVESVGSCRFQIHLYILACVMSRKFTRDSVTKFLPAQFP